jgi:hypothetical protein
MPVTVTSKGGVVAAASARRAFAVASTSRVTARPESNMLSTARMAIRMSGTVLNAADPPLSGLSGEV